MQLRSPAEGYIKCLIVHPDGLSNEEIERTLGLAGLDFISATYVNTLRALLGPTPRVFYPFDPSHTASFRFLQERGLAEFFHRTPAVREASALLGVPRAKEFVEAMFVTKAPISGISAAVQRVRDHAISEAGLQMYEKFYWNVSLLDSVQLRTLLQMRYERLAELSTAEGRALARATKYVRYQDPRKVAADLPSSPLAALLIQMKMGVSPANLDMVRRLESTKNVAILRAEECALNGTPSDSKRASEWATTAKLMKELLDSEHRPDEQLHERLSVIALKSEDRPILSIRELTGGNVTVDLQPEPTSETVDGGAAEDDDDGSDDPLAGGD